MATIRLIATINVNEQQSGLFTGYLERSGGKLGYMLCKAGVGNVVEWYVLLVPAPGIPPDPGPMPYDEGDAYARAYG